MTTPLLSSQRAAVELLIHKADADIPPEIIACAKEAAVTLAWLERRRELFLAVHELDKRRPDLAELFRVWPDAIIADVRDTMEMEDAA